MIKLINTISIVGLVLFSMCSLKPDKKSTNGSDNIDQSQSNKGIIYINISSIYRDGGEIIFSDENSDTTISIKNRHINFKDGSFDIKEDEHLYKEKILVKDYYPEYGLFVLNCVRIEKDYYVVEVNSKQLRLLKSTKNHIVYKELEEYIMDVYPIVSDDHPLKESPSIDSKTIQHKKNMTFNTIKVEGDWILVETDNDCYSGASPSEESIRGWMRWRKDDMIIIDVAYIC